MFSINCLEITVTRKTWNDKSFQSQNRSIYKNLLSDADFEFLDTDNTPVNKRFLFNDFYKIENGNLVENTDRALPEDFFGKNINIQAIVGKNGSGKSTLMDLMYMAINNFCYMFERGNDRPGADGLCYVPGLNVKLHASSNDNFLHQEFSLSIDDLKLSFNHPSFQVPLEFEIDSNHSLIENKQDKHKGCSNSKIVELADKFFYTIVSNYSMQAFVSNNYIQETYTHIFDKNNPNIQWDEKDNAPWINPIFHKNDGYTRSIVLNPYRDNGNIDLENEFELSKDRITSLFVAQSAESQSLFSPYTLKKITIDFDDNYLNQQGESVTRLLNKYGKSPDANTIFAVNYTTDFWGKSILEVFNISKNESSEYFKSAIDYIRLKTIKIVLKYDAYKEYRNALLLLIDSIILQQEPIPSIKEAILKLLKALNNDISHITKKIRQTINFINSDHCQISNELNQQDILDKVSGSINPESISSHLPPPFYKYELILSKTSAKNTTTDIKYNQLSSGEIQFLQTISIHIYHLLNLLSVPANQDRPKYKRFNLVFDELEISFHPEMQRQFINHLISIFKDLSLPKDYFVNIFVITHSPFILSDIPASNILYLKDGSQDTTKKRLSFAQNIGEMMYDSFFMEKTIGDFAEEKIKRLVRKKLEKNSKKKQKLMSDAEEQAILKAIGDPVIRSLIDEIEANDD